ncbi:MAG TPA: LysE family transporter [Chloroflexota bacterium]|nr:LysE family transporter [Chloroflexota bacterium]
MLPIILTSLLLGFVFSATPGAVNAESLRRGITRGFRAALSVQLGSLLGDMVWAGVALTGLAFLVENRPIALLLGIVGACFLLRQAVSAFAGAMGGDGSGRTGLAGRGDLVTGLLFSLTNPFAVAFWLGLGAGMTATAHRGPIATLSVFAGFFAGALLWCVFFSTLVSIGRRYATHPVLRAVDAVAGIALSYFGVRLLWRSLQALRILRLARILAG